MSNLDDHALQTSTVVSHESGNMSDELNVWRDAKSMQEYRPLPSQAAADELSAAVIRDYGDKRDADAYERGKLEGARLALEEVSSITLMLSEKCVCEIKQDAFRAWAGIIAALDPTKIVDLA